MTLFLGTSSVQRTHPLLYWITVAYIVGLPNFLQFDPTGRTHELGLINLTSISRIALTLLTAYLLFVTMLLERRSFFPRKIKLSTGIWLALLAMLTFATILQPASRLSSSLSTDLPLGFFRLGEWVLAFLLFRAVYTRNPLESAASTVVEIIGRCSWIIVALVWIVLPIAPHLAYGAADEAGLSGQLGGQLINPGLLAFHAGCAFLYSLFYGRTAYLRTAACSVALITLLLTRERTPLIGFIVATVVYIYFYSGKPALRWVTAIALTLLAGVAGTFGESSILFFSRGQSVKTLATLSDRLQVWQACWDAIRVRPELGYGYIVGAKHAIHDHWFYSHWLPPHAHNDFVQITLEAGLPAFVLLLSLYAILFTRALRAGSSSREHLFMLLLGLQLGVIAMTGLVLSYVYSSEGAVFLLCYIALADSAQQRETFALSRNPGLRVESRVFS